MIGNIEKEGVVARGEGVNAYSLLSILYSNLIVIYNSVSHPSD
jgi:hypothetical protein